MPIPLYITSVVARSVTNAMPSTRPLLRRLDRKPWSLSPGLGVPGARGWPRDQGLGFRAQNAGGGGGRAPAGQIPPHPFPYVYARSNLNPKLEILNFLDLEISDSLGRGFLDSDFPVSGSLGRDFLVSGSGFRYAH